MKRIVFILLAFFVPVFFLSEVGAQSKKTEQTERDRKVARAEKKLRKQLEGAARKCWDATVWGLRSTKKVFNETRERDNKERRKKKKN